MPLPQALRRHLADTRPLAHPHYRRLWTTNIVTVIGGQLTVVTVPAQLWAITHDSGMVGLTGLFGLVPLLVFGLWGGALADHLDRRLMLLISTVGLIATSGLFFAQALLGWTNPWVILTVFAVQQAFFAMNSPARTAILPEIVNADELPAAMSLNMTLFTFGAIAGPMLGGVLLPVFGFAWLYLIDTLTLTATLYAVLRLPPLRPRRDAEAPASRPGLRSIGEGLVHAARNPVLALSLVADLIAMIAGMPRALFPQLANQGFGGPAAGGMELAVLFAGIPLGSFLGGVFSGWVSGVRRHGVAVIACVAAWGVAMIGFGIAAGLGGGHWWPALVVATLCLAVGGAADIASGAFRQSILVQAASDHVRGRMQGLFFVVVAGGPRLADLAHGWGATLAPPGVVAAVGGALVVLGMGLLAWLTPSFRAYTAPTS